ncbi:ATP-binding protein [Kitasatospora viridis]|uniref:Anti-sigma regulatory factor (Ser/Thr protein kinase) n=1 Tax=Kitasatospora viridis TaxID=281105 RepID=A0A561UGZ4_9ACTN|nr:ATP-binding protein [Kitasatospora viridis]TWF98626.1 anti-sigma regulatory factor (Ser/Thr protein kinase) [Kitasatospora viridis]
MDIWWTLHLKRELASVPLARRILLNTLATAKVAESIAQDLALALTEACANAVEHARGDDGFQVTAALDGELLRIEVVDSGPGLPAAPRLLPPPPPHRPSTSRSLAPHGHPRRRRGRASLPAPGPVHRSRPTAYDVHVLPPRRPAPAAPRLPDLDHFPDPTAESGRGLLLIRALTDQVRLHNHPQRGAIVSFEKHLTPTPDPLLRVAS